jgi:hypothetical protein
MGTLLEVLWAFEANNLLRIGNYGLLLAWLGDQYNDFALVNIGEEWNSMTRAGEVLRVEMKTMDLDAGESKAHFDGLVGTDIQPSDMLLVVYWRWIEIENDVRAERFPQITDYFFGSATDIALLRDRLHVARGGTFVNRNNCPDGCLPVECSHHGEPLNANGRREKITGPNTRRVSSSTPSAANFGGMTRMIGVSNDERRRTLQTLRRDNDTIHRYLSFVHNSQPSRERSTYNIGTWRELAQSFGLEEVDGLTKFQIQEIMMRTHGENYRDVLRTIEV